MEITSFDEAQKLANAIRSGAITGQEKAVAMQELRKWHSREVSQKDDSEAAAARKKNFFERMGDNIDKRNAMMVEIAEASKSGEQSYAESLLQTTGKYGAGLVMDFLAEGVVSGARGLSFITPDVVEDPVKQGATWVGYKILESDAGQAGIAAAIQGVDAYQEWAKDNPRMARNVESLVNIAALAAPVKAKPKGSLSSGSKVADRLRLSADQKAFKNRTEFVEDLVGAPKTKLVKEDEVLRTDTKTILGFPVATKAVPTAPETQSAFYIRQLAEVSPKNSLVQNAQAIKRAIVKEGQALTAKLRGKEVMYPVEKLEKVLGDIKVGLADGMVVKGDALAAAEGLIDDAMKLIHKRGTVNLAGKKHAKLSDVFEVRKEIDQAFVRAGRPPSRWAELGTTENGQSVALRELRKNLNDFVAANARTPDVKESLRKQAAYYNALDNIVPKAASEANTVFGKIWSHALKVLPLRGEINQLGALAWGMGGLGAGAILGPAMSSALFGGLGGYGTYAALTSPAARRGLAAMLDQLSKVAKMPGMTASQLHQLRADRAYIMDLLKASEDNLPYEIDPKDVTKVVNDDDEKKLELKK